MYVACCRYNSLCYASRVRVTKIYPTHYYPLATTLSCNCISKSLELYVITNIEVLSMVQLTATSLTNLRPLSLSLPFPFLLFYAVIYTIIYSLLFVMQIRNILSLSQFPIRIIIIIIITRIIRIRIRN